MQGVLKSIAESAEVGQVGKDGGGWALPGGMVDKGEGVSEAARREFAEEAAAFPAGSAEAREFAALSAELFASEKKVYAGYAQPPPPTAK